MESEANINRDTTRITLELVLPFTKADLNVALKCLKIGKVTGIDDIRD